MNSFGNRLYGLRKSKGLSQEALAEKLNVTRQTVSKWELGESTPDMEKLLALSTLFDISLDELMLGNEQKRWEKEEGTMEKTIASVLNEKILTEPNEKRAKSFLTIAGIILGAMLAVDAISFVVYFLLHGTP